MLNCQILLLLAVSTVVLSSQVQGTVELQSSVDIFRGGCTNNAIGMDVKDPLTITFQPSTPQITINPSSITFTPTQRNQTYQLCATNDSNYGAYSVAISISGPEASRVALKTPNMTVNVVDPTKIMNNAMTSMASTFASLPTNMFSLGGLTQNTLSSLTIPNITSLGNIFGSTLAPPINQIQTNPTVLVPPTPTTPQIMVTPPTNQINTTWDNLSSSQPALTPSMNNSFSLSYMNVKASPNSILLRLLPPYNLGRVIYVAYPTNSTDLMVRDFQQVIRQVESGNNFYSPSPSQYNLTMEDRKFRIGSFNTNPTFNELNVTLLQPSTLYQFCSLLITPENYRSKVQCLRARTLDAIVHQAWLSFMMPATPLAVNKILCKIVDDLRIQTTSLMTSFGEICNRQSNRPSIQNFDFPGKTLDQTTKRKIFLVSGEPNYSSAFLSMFQSMAQGANMRESFRNILTAVEPTFTSGKYLGQASTDQMVAYRPQNILLNNVQNQNGNISFAFNQRPTNNTVVYYVRVPSNHRPLKSEEIMNCKTDLNSSPTQYCGRFTISPDQTSRQLKFPEDIRTNNEKIVYTFATQNPIRPYFSSNVYELPIGSKAITTGPTPTIKSARHLLLIPLILFILLQ